MSSRLTKKDRESCGVIVVSAAPGSLTPRVSRSLLLLACLQVPLAVPGNSHHSKFFACSQMDPPGTSHIIDILDMHLRRTEYNLDAIRPREKAKVPQLAKLTRYFAFHIFHNESCILFQLPRYVVPDLRVSDEAIQTVLTPWNPVRLTISYQILCLFTFLPRLTTCLLVMYPN